MRKVFGILEICLGIVYAIITILFLFVFDIEVGLYLCCVGGFVSCVSWLVVLGLSDIHIYKKDKENKND